MVQGQTKKLFLALLKMDVPFTKHRKKRELKIKGLDAQGWVLRDELSSPQSLLYPGPKIKDKDLYFKKGLMFWVGDPVIEPLIEIRAKRTGQRKENNPLEYTERILKKVTSERRGGTEIVRSQVKTRRGSAYRLKRDLDTWSKAFLLARDCGDLFFIKFVYSPYTTGLHDKVVIPFLRRFVRTLTAPIKEFDTLVGSNPEEQIWGREEIIENFIIHHAPLIEIYLRDPKEFKLVAKTLWAAVFDMVLIIEDETDLSKSVKSALFYSFFRQIGFVQEVINESMRKIKTGGGRRGDEVIGGDRSLHA